MAFDAALWSDKIESAELPAYPCPTCSRGRMVAPKKPGTRAWEPTYSKRATSHEDYTPHWDIKRFVGLLKCTEATCGEIVIVSGDEVYEDVYDEEYGHGLTTVRYVKAAHPAPRIIEVSKNVPEIISKPVFSAFSLYWIDLGATANRIRSALERLMDDKGIKKNTVNSQRKRVPLVLASRIQIFENKFGIEHKVIMSAIRLIGNAGSHGQSDRNAVLAGFELLEYLLREIYDKPGKSIAKRAKAITKSKGKVR